MIRLEEGLKATNQRMEDGFKATNQRIDDGLKATNQRIDDLKADMKSDMNRRFEQVDKRFDQIMAFMFWGFGILFGLFFSGMGFLVGFVLWDRRTTLTPVVKTTRELETRTERLELAMKEKAEKDPELKEALRHAGLL
ncbi:MAG: hypothetical protein HQK89_13110 [Nitrospirae bacterium]|nr:hypothetical protein [Nitrospirota bacterium]